MQEMWLFVLASCLFTSERRRVYSSDLTQITPQLIHLLFQTRSRLHNNLWDLKGLLIKWCVLPFSPGYSSTGTQKP